MYAAILPEIGPDGKEITGTIELAPGETKTVPTGIALEIPQGIWGGVYARSGLATKHGLRPCNCVGVIDSDYRGEIIVALHNDSTEYQYVTSGDRIAQLIFHEQIYLTENENGEVFTPVQDLSETERGEGGFGSTGIN